jgi:hypothetical protein
VESLPGAFAMLAVAGYCVVLLAVSVRLPVSNRTSLALHTVMAAAMVGMYRPALALPVPPTVWRIVFGALAGGLLARWWLGRDHCYRRDHAPRPAELAEHRDHGVAAGAMVFVLAPTDWTPPPAADVLAVALTAALVIIAVRSAHAACLGAWDLVARRPRPGPAHLFVAPLWPRCCETLMAAAMAAMVFAR